MNFINFDNVLNELKDNKGKKQEKIKKINIDNIVDSLEMHRNRNKNLDKREDYDYLITNVINNGIPKIKNDKSTIFLCFYGIISINNNPLILYVSQKYGNNIDFTHFKTNKETFKTKLNSELNNIKDILNQNYSYKGYKEFNNNYYLFYELPIINPSILCDTNKYYFITISEIINLKKVYNYLINQHIIDIFTSNSDLCILMKDEMMCPTPTVMYHKLFDHNSLNTMASNQITKGHEKYSPNIYYYFLPVNKINIEKMLRCIFFISKLFIINDHKIINEQYFINIQKDYDTVLLTNAKEHIFIKFDKNNIEELDTLL